MKAREDLLLTSTLTLGEIMVKPLANRRPDLAEKYRSFLKSPEIRLLDFDEASAEAFAQIRASSNVKAPDAIQLACASAYGCDLFLTNDDRLHQLVIPGIQFVSKFDLAPL